MAMVGALADLRLINRYSSEQLIIYSKKPTASRRRVGFYVSYICELITNYILVLIKNVRKY